MNATRRILAVTWLRVREWKRVSHLYLFAFLGLAIAACLLVPVEPGPERQRAIDRLVLDAALLVTALAAAVRVSLDSCLRSFSRNPRDILLFPREAHLRRRSSPLRLT